MTSSSSNPLTSVQALVRSHPNAATVGIAGLVLAGALIVSQGGPLALYQQLKNRFYSVKSDGSQTPGYKETKLLMNVLNRAAKNNPESVLAVIDDFGWKTSWLMNVGDVKGKILKNEVLNRQPKVAVEFGGYCGYSAILIASSLPVDGHLYSLEVDPFHAGIASRIIDFAGLSNKITIINGTAANSLPLLKSKYGITNIDLLFIDHVKTLYLSDFKLVEASGLLPSGAVIVADNIIKPGAPDYLQYVQSNPNYRTTLHQTTLEYKTTDKDAVAVTVKL